MSCGALPLLCHNCGQVVLPTSKATLISQETYRETQVTSASQAENVKAQLGTLDADIDAIDASVDALNRAKDSLNRSLSVMSERRAALRDSRARYLSLLSPIRRLPAELLSDIFLFAVGSGPYYRSVVVAKLSLGWTCSYWRDVAAITSGLWNEVVVTPGEAGPLNLPLLNEVFLPRSGSTPLTVHMDLVERPLVVQEELLNIVRTLLGVSSRWEKIVFQSVTWSYSVLMAVGPLNLPMLRDLTIYMADPWIAGLTDTGSYVSPTFSSEPSLRSVGLSDVRFGAVELPWTQLTALEIFGGSYGKPSWNQLLYYLNSCPNLRTFTVTVDFRGEPAHSETPVHHDVLETWHIDCGGDNTVEEGFFSIFAAVTLPRLVDLSMECLRIRMPWDHLAFMAFLSRSACSIRSFTLKEAIIDPETLLHALSAMPTLEYLRLDQVLGHDTKLFFTRLTYAHPHVYSKDTKPPPCMLHMLQELYLAGMEDFEDEFFIAMLWSRTPSVVQSFEAPHDNWEWPKPLRTVGVAEYHLTDAVEAEIGAWNGAGLCVFNEDD